MTSPNNSNFSNTILNLINFSNATASSKKAKRQRRGRQCRIEELEGREMLSVSPWALADDLLADAHLAGTPAEETEYRLKEECEQSQLAPTTGLEPLGGLQYPVDQGHKKTSNIGVVDSWINEPLGSHNPSVGKDQYFEHTVNFKLAHTGDQHSYVSVFITLANNVDHGKSRVNLTDEHGRVYDAVRNGNTFTVSLENKDAGNYKFYIYLRANSSLLGKIEASIRLMPPIAPPMITAKPPETLNWQAGTTQELTVEANKGDYPGELSFQWKYWNNTAGRWDNASGVSNKNSYVPDTTDGIHRSYTCVVTNTRDGLTAVRDSGVTTIILSIGNPYHFHKERVQNWRQSSDNAVTAV